MRRSIGILFGVVIGFPLLLALTSRAKPARVLAKTDRVRLMLSTGQWFHNYELLVVKPRDGNAAPGAIDTFTIDAARNLFDAMRIGARVQLNHLPMMPRMAWLSDSSSSLRTISYFVQSRFKSYSHPEAISPLAVQTAGLARVSAVHSIRRRQPFWRNAQQKGASGSSQWMHLVEVEFWAPRLRTLVRTIDVVDAGSIPGLQPGDIVQMHYDQNEPRTLRLDDGRRTFGSGQ